MHTLDSRQTLDNTGSGSSAPILNAQGGTEFAFVFSSLDSRNLAGVNTRFPARFAGTSLAIGVGRLDCVTSLSPKRSSARLIRSSLPAASPGWLDILILLVHVVV